MQGKSERVGPRRIIPAVIRPTTTSTCRILGLFLCYRGEEARQRWFGQSADAAGHWLALLALGPFDVVAEFQCFCDVYKRAGPRTLQASLPGRILEAVAPTCSSFGASRFPIILDELLF